MSNQKKYGFTTLSLILAIAALVTLVVVTGITSYLSVYNESINTTRQQNRALINQIEGWLAVKANQVENNAIFMHELDVDIDMIIQYFTIQANLIEDVSLAFAGFPNGDLILSGEQDITEGVYAQYRPWYIEAADRPGEVVFSRPYM